MILKIYVGIMDSFDSCKKSVFYHYDKSDWNET